MLGTPLTTDWLRRHCRSRSRRLHIGCGDLPLRCPRGRSLLHRCCAVSEISAPPWVAWHDSAKSGRRHGLLPTAVTAPPCAAYTRVIAVAAAVWAHRVV